MESPNRFLRSGGVAFVYTVEAFEDTLLVIDRNADAVIFYSQYRMVFDGDHVDFHFAEGLVILDRIVAQVIDHLIEVCGLPFTTVGFPVSIRVI